MTSAKGLWPLAFGILFLQHTDIPGQIVGSRFPAAFLVRNVVHQPMDPGLGNERVFHRQHTAYAPAGTGIELDKFDIGDLFVFQRLQNANDIFHAVCRQIIGLLQGRTLAAGDGPAYAAGAGGHQIFGLSHFFNLFPQIVVHFGNGDHRVHIALVNADMQLCVGGFGRTG